MIKESWKSYVTQGWSYVHLFGSACLFMLIVKLLNGNILFASLITMLLGATWEFIDAMYSTFPENKFLSQIFDHRGADYKDIIFDATGIIIGVIIHTI